MPAQGITLTSSWTALPSCEAEVVREVIGRRKEILTSKMLKLDRNCHWMLEFHKFAKTHEKYLIKREAESCPHYLK